MYSNRVDPDEEQEHDQDHRSRLSIWKRFIAAMNELKRSRQAWDSRAREDAMWNILTDPTKTGRQWSEEEFFETGRKEITALMDYLCGLGVAIQRDAVVLDFGCGIGRLSQALA